MEKTIEIKQSEYNFLLEGKDQEIQFFQEEILKLNEQVEIVKRDRIRDQRNLSEYEQEITYLNNKIQEISENKGEVVNRDSNSSLKLEVHIYFIHNFFIVEKNCSCKKFCE